ncbi:DNA polymerase [Toxoplasma gondii p89]|nr:DNA polymerase [Toxoplasma gondii p89]
MPLCPAASRGSSDACGTAPKRSLLSSSSSLTRSSPASPGPGRENEDGDGDVLWIDGDEVVGGGGDIEEMDWSEGNRKEKRQFRTSVTSDPFIDLSSPSPKTSNTSRRNRHHPEMASSSSSSSSSNSSSSSSNSSSNSSSSSSSSSSSNSSSSSSSSSPFSASSSAPSSPAKKMREEGPFSGGHTGGEKARPKSYAGRLGVVPGPSWLERELRVSVWSGVGTKRGYLYNMVQMQAEVATSEDKKETVSGLHLYFVSETGASWRTSLLYRPYFYISLRRTRASYFEQLKEALMDLLGDADVRFEKTFREDLSDPLHLRTLLSGGPAPDEGTNSSLREFVQISFANVKQLVDARDELRKIVRRNQERRARQREEERLASFAEKTKAKDGAFASYSHARFAAPDDINFADIAFSNSCQADEGRDGRDMPRGGRQEDSKNRRKKQQGEDVTALIEDIFEADVLYITR